MNVDFNALYAIQNFLQLVNDNWTVIIVIVALIISIDKRRKSFSASQMTRRLQSPRSRFRRLCLS